MSEPTESIGLDPRGEELVKTVEQLRHGGGLTKGLMNTQPHDVALLRDEAVSPPPMERPTTATRSQRVASSS